jgi:nitrite reductase/ring-hydroxylating ferredoxin subunit
VAAKLEGDHYPDDLCYDMYDPYHYYRTHEIDGQKFLIAGGEDHKTAHNDNTEACFHTLERHVREHFPVEQIAYKWSSQYFEPADGLPYIGHLPGHSENIFVATGFGVNGMTYSHVAALIFRSLLTEGDSVYKDLFAPGRVKPVAGFANFVKESADVIAQFFDKRFSQTTLHQFAEMAPGEGKVVKYEGESIALYKDGNGRLHAVNPVCPHAKCMVAWNTAEKSWDCPCHGSRFSMDGEVLTGPARTGLEKIELTDL